MLGKVKWFSNEKGYGFITSDDDQDHYFHVQHVKGAVLPSNGDTVEFDSAEGEKGLKATNIVIKDKATQNQQRNDRIECHGCGKMIVPRIITDKGSLDHSVCPFCGIWIEDYSIIRNIIRGIFKLAIKNPIPTAVVAILVIVVINLK